MSQALQILSRNRLGYEIQKTAKLLDRHIGVSEGLRLGIFDANGYL